MNGRRAERDQACRTGAHQDPPTHTPHTTPYPAHTGTTSRIPTWDYDPTPGGPLQTEPIPPTFHTGCATVRWEDRLGGDQAVSGGIGGDRFHPTHYFSSASLVDQVPGITCNNCPT